MSDPLKITIEVQADEAVKTLTRLADGIRDPRLEDTELVKALVGPSETISTEAEVNALLSDLAGLGGG